jgi:hypothetical protein
MKTKPTAPKRIKKNRIGVDFDGIPFKRIRIHAAKCGETAAAFVRRAAIQVLTEEGGSK